MVRMMADTTAVQIDGWEARLILKLIRADMSDCSHPQNCITCDTIRELVKKLEPIERELV